MGDEQLAENLAALLSTEEREPARLSRLKKRLQKGFKWTRREDLANMMELAYWSFLYGRVSSAEQICQFLGQYEFQGDYTRWGYVEAALALGALLCQGRGDSDSAKIYVEAIRARDFVEERCQLRVLDVYRRNIAIAQSEGDATREIVWRMNALIEATVLLAACDQNSHTSSLQAHWSENVAHIRSLTKIKPLPGTEEVSGVLPNLIA